MTTNSNILVERTAALRAQGVLAAECGRWDSAANLAKGSHKALKVVHLSTYDTSGGAAVAAYRLHQGLIAAGIDSHMLVKEKRSGDPAVSQIAPRRPVPLWRRLLEARVGRWLYERRLRDGIPDGAYHGIHSECSPADFAAALDADVIHLHWTCGFLDWPAVLPWLALRKPVVWTLHDMHPLLGVLNYRHPDEQLPKAFEMWENRILRLKGRILANVSSDRLSLIAPSRWMAQQAQQCAHASRFPLRHIPYGIDETQFRPGKKEIARQALQIPEGKTVIGFIAQNIDDRRKGLAILRAALQSVDNQQQVFLLTAGGGWPRIDGFDGLHLGILDSTAVLTLFYNALDLFACPSLLDNLPNTILEAMSCGVPVVAFDTGGISDMIRANQNGWLVSPAGDSKALASAIAEALTNQPQALAFSSESRKCIEAQFTLARQAQDCLAAYRAFTSVAGRA